MCDVISGQCRCKPGVAEAGQQNVDDLVNDLQCRSCLINQYGHHSGDGCKPCLCDPEGSMDTQCDDNGTCRCIPTVAGERCERCDGGFYLKTAEGCR